MSIAEVERLVADLKSDATLRAEAEQAQAGTSLAATLAFAASKGYAFTADHMRAHIKAKARAAGKELTDAQLDGVAGGTSSSVTAGFIDLATFG